MIHAFAFLSASGERFHLEKLLPEERPPWFIFTVSGGVVFGLGLPLVMGLTMKMSSQRGKL